MSTKHLFLTLFSILILASACNKDEECTVLADTIVGTWTSVISTSDIEFQSNGTLIDPEDSIIGGELNGTVLDEKSWSVSNDSLHVRAESGAQFLSASFDVPSFDCDVVTLEFVGIEFTLNRK